MRRIFIVSMLLLFFVGWSGVSFSQTPTPTPIDLYRKARLYFEKIETLASESGDRLEIYVAGKKSFDGNGDPVIEGLNDSEKTNLREGNKKLVLEIQGYLNCIKQFHQGNDCSYP